MAQAGQLEVHDVLVHCELLPAQINGQIDARRRLDTAPISANRSITVFGPDELRSARIAQRAQA